MAVFGPSETALNHITRYSARLSFLIFILVLVISPIATLRPSPLRCSAGLTYLPVGLVALMCHDLRCENSERRVRGHCTSLDSPSFG